MLHLSFLRRTSVGPAIFRIKDVKLGRQTSNVHITLTQDSDSEKVVGYLIQSNMITEHGLSVSTKWSLFPPPYPADLTQFPMDNDRHWKLQNKVPFPGFRRASTKVQLYIPRDNSSETLMIDEWIRFSDGGKFTMESLGYVADMFPQLVEMRRHENNNPLKTTSNSVDKNMEKGSTTTDLLPNQDARYWYPTLSLNLDIKKLLPAEGVEWLFVRVRTKKIEGGRMDLEILIIDQEDDLVALSNHVALILRSERNTAKRKDRQTISNL